MQEVRQGLSDLDMPASRQITLAISDSSFGLRKAHTYASVMGRCGGSLRGKLCKLSAPLARPVIEQLDLFHSSILQTLEQMQQHISDLERQIQDMKQDNPSQEKK